MQTMNISLTKDQVEVVDQLIAVHGYANRSEFFRSLLRLVNKRPQIIDQTNELVFAPPNTKNTQKILADFRATKKYSPAFLRDLKTGLEESNYFHK
ncbi:MAG: ribbon-helix-helix domain-containing protein [Candidatus Shapirobacteria bacterium]